MKRKNSESVKSLAEMFNAMDGPNRAKILENVAKRDPELVKLIQEQMFVFEDIAKMNDKSLQTLIREIPQTKLVLALRTANDEFKGRIFENMSSRAVEALKEELEIQKPQRVSDVQKVQQEIIELAKKLESEGKLLLKSEPDMV